MDAVKPELPPGYVWSRSCGEPAVDKCRKTVGFVTADSGCFNASVRVGDGFEHYENCGTTEAEAMQALAIMLWTL